MWPWQEDPESWNKLIKKSIALVAINNTIVAAGFTYIGGVLENFVPKHTLAIEALPDKFTLVWQMYLCIMIEDVAFSISHRILHTPWFYRHIHKVHHTYVQQVSISATYAHPVEYTLGNLLPVGLPFMILNKRIHFYTYLVYVFFRIVDTTLGHSGYDFPWLAWYDLVPLRGTPSLHEFHHSGAAFWGNYSGMTTVCDTLWGTNAKYWKEFKGKWCRA